MTTQDTITITLSELDKERLTDSNIENLQFIFKQIINQVVVTQITANGEGFKKGAIAVRDILQGPNVIGQHITEPTSENAYGNGANDLPYEHNTI